MPQTTAIKKIAEANAIIGWKKKTKNGVLISQHKRFTRDNNEPQMLMIEPAPLIKIRKKRFTQKLIECPICFEKIKCGRTPCGHEFCYDCAKKMKEGSKLKCPMCREETSFKIFIRKFEEYDVSDFKK